MMKNTPADNAVSDAVHRATAEHVRQIVERVERLEAEKAEIAAQVKEVWAAAKVAGFQVGPLKKVVAARKKNPDDAAVERAVIEMYADLLGVTA